MAVVAGGTPAATAQQAPGYSAASCWPTADHCCTHTSRHCHCLHSYRKLCIVHRVENSVMTVCDNDTNACNSPAMLGGPPPCCSPPVAAVDMKLDILLSWQHIERNVTDGTCSFDSLLKYL